MIDEDNEIGESPSAESDPTMLKQGQDKPVNAANVKVFCHRRNEENLICGSGGQVRAAANACPKVTGLSIASHPRCVVWVSNESLRRAALFLQQIEGTTDLREQEQAVTVILFLLEPDGGERPIAPLSGLLRLRFRVRREVARDWERAEAARP